MISGDLHERLAQLNRERLPPRATATTSRQEPVAASNDFTLAALIPGLVLETACGPHYQVQRPLADLWPDATTHLEIAALRRQGQAERTSELHPELAALAAGFPEACTFLDLETCGFAGSGLFLVGLVRAEGTRLVLEQLLARHYGEERAVLETLGARLSEHDVLVTFNGKSFDVPMIRDRRVFHRMDSGSDAGPLLPAWHCDVLHHARRRWGARLPDCKLQTLERYVCRRVRQGDIPGSQVPQEYHHFVRTGDARQLASILHHNALDLVTLVQVALRLA